MADTYVDRVLAGDDRKAFSSGPLRGLFVHTQTQFIPPGGLNPKGELCTSTNTVLKMDPGLPNLSVLSTEALWPEVGYVFEAVQPLDQTLAENMLNNGFFFRTSTM